MRTYKPALSLTLYEDEVETLCILIENGLDRRPDLESLIQSVLGRLRSHTSLNKWATDENSQVLPFDE